MIYDYKLRMMLELGELAKKYEKLCAYLDINRTTLASTKTEELMLRQRTAMAEYMCILSERLNYPECSSEE